MQEVPLTMSITEKIKEIIARSKQEKQTKAYQESKKQQRKDQKRQQHRRNSMLAREGEVFDAEVLDQAYLEGLKKAPAGAVALSDDKVVLKDAKKSKTKTKTQSGKVEKGNFERVHKVIARAGVCSVRKAEEFIAQGQVSVNGERATIGQQVNIADAKLVIRVNGEVINHKSALKQPCRVIIYNKAEGEISTKNDPEGRPTVFDRLPRLKVGRWVQVGRLDANTSGLLLFTNDGELAYRLMHPSYQIERKYVCRVYGHVTQQVLDRLEKGVNLEDGLARFNKVKRLNPEGVNRSNEWFEVSLNEGRNHEVRRLWESQDLVVSRLIRTEYAGIALNRQLSIPTSGYLEADLNEINMLRGSVGLAPETVGFRPGDYGQSKSELKRQKQKQLKVIRSAIRKDAQHRPQAAKQRDERTKDKRERRQALVSKISSSNKQKFSKSAPKRHDESMIDNILESLSNLRDAAFKKK